MKEVIEAGILIILVLIGLLLFMEIIKRYVRGLVNSSDGSTHKLHNSFSGSSSNVAQVKVGEAKSPFIAQSYRDMVSIPVPEDDTNEEEETKLDVARRNERSLAPDEDNPFVQDVRDYAAFHRCLRSGHIPPRDKRLVMTGIDKVAGTQFEGYYKEELDHLRELIYGLDSNEVDLPSNDIELSDSGFQVDMPEII